MRKCISMLVAALLAVGLWASAMAAVPTAEDLEPMLPALDSVLRASSVEHQAYDPNDPECVWMILYLMGVNWGYVSEEVQVGQEPIVVPEAVMRRFARAAFADLEELPAFPESYADWLRYDETQNAYLLPGSDAGETSTEIEGIITSADGPLSVVIGFYGGEERYDGMTVTLIPNDDPLFPYAIQSVTIQ